METKERTVITVSNTVNAPVEKVWDALVNPELIKKYMFGAEVKSGWKPGDSITWKGEWEGKPYDQMSLLQERPDTMEHVRQ